ncbi:MAG TPA: glycosyltransferase family 39 protein [Candidatus Binataceae bacterium]|jgi:4-amino-4-deoxy-L-arabinose transferase-like glycosyltransferase|nr:glycosyltransferase family 39 protein [Candidatus Binataceae bacterium]
MTRPAFRIFSAFVLALFFLGQGMKAPFQKDDEARPAGIILDIVSHNHWLVPADLYGEPTRKPPLFYWMSAAIAHMRGGVVDEPGARAVSLLAAAATAVIVAEVACAHFGAIPGWLAYLFLMGTYGFASRAAFARTDMLFTFFVFAAYCALFPLAEGAESTPRAIGTGALLGLAILTKGPLAMALCTLGVGMYFAMMGRNPLGLCFKRWPWIVLSVALGIGAGWYIPAFIRDPGLLRVQIVEENLGHFLPARLGGTGEARRPFYYMFLRFLGATLPLNFYLPAAVPIVMRERKSGGMLLYQFGLLLAMLCFFTIASAKRDDYILYAIPPFAIVIAAPFARVAASANRTSVRLADIASSVAGVAMLLLATVGFIIYGYTDHFFRIAARMHPSDTAYLRAFIAATEHRTMRIELTLVVIAITSVSALYIVFRQNGRVAALSIALAELAALSLWIGLLTPRFARNHTLKDFVLKAKDLAGYREVAIADARNYEVSYYFGREVPAWPKPFATSQRPPDAAYMFVWSRDLDRIHADLPQSSTVLESGTITNRGRMLFLSVDRQAQPSG